MPETLKIDPNKGFVALPAQILDLEISPGAFRVLTHLCNLANEAGWCWPSLEQLGDKLRRSKASISAYLTELREHHLIETVAQKMASGYNYRLKIMVTFWAEWIEIRQQKRIKPVRRADRSVQKVERPSTSKNKIHKTQDSRALVPEEVSSDIKMVFDKWKDLTTGLPFGSYKEPPGPKLISKTDALLHKYKPQNPVDVTAVTFMLTNLWSGLGVEIAELDLTSQVKACMVQPFSMKDMEALQRATLEIWQRHWKSPPNTKQFGEILKKAKNADQANLMIRSIKIDYRTWQRSSAAKKNLASAA